ncbi:MAG: hypothetical protein GY845_32510 [Planctomycetes bacterium]|nr:hypothetical protein [Planctomycetota bacterium]
MLRDYFRKIITNPPHITIQKICNKIALMMTNIRKRQRDFYRDTRIDFNAPIISETYFDASTMNTTASRLNTFDHMAQMFCGHRFDLLGSGWIKNSYSNTASGREDKRFDMNQDIEEFDQKGGWLNHTQRNVHAEKSAQIWQNVSEEYDPIDWQKDFISGFRFNTRQWYKDQRHKHSGMDIKVPWELARMQHLPVIALSAVILKEKRQILILEFKDQVLDFIASNPPRMGVNWTCTMDVAIRVANMLIAYDLFSQLDTDNVIDTNFRQIFSNSIHEHNIHIVDNLERAGSLTSNHYLSNLAGMLLASLYTKDEVRKDFALAELKEEMFKQVYSDGTDFEASTCYHRLVLELFFYSTYWSVKSHIDFSGRNYKQTAEKIFGVEYTERLYAMFDAVLHLLKPNGEMPQIGDNDSGQFTKLWPRDVLDMRYILALGAVFFNEPSWKIRQFFDAEQDVAEISILYGQQGLDCWKQLSWSDLDSVKSKSFSDSGWYVMRSGADYCIISCGPNGQNGNGGHAHNDKLSIELMLNGKDVVIDPGTYVYTPLPKWRDYFRHTRSHSTIVIEDTEQDDLPINLFSMPQLCTRQCIEFKTDECEDVFVGRISRNEFSCLRKIYFNKIKGELNVKDDIHIKENKSYHANIVLAPGVSVNTINFSTDGKVTDHNTWYSPQYGVKLPTTCLKIKDYHYFTIGK